MHPSLQGFCLSCTNYARCFVRLACQRWLDVIAAAMLLEIAVVLMSPAKSHAQTFEGRVRH